MNCVFTCNSTELHVKAYQVLVFANAQVNCVAALQLASLFHGCLRLQQHISFQHVPEFQVQLLLQICDGKATTTLHQDLVAYVRLRCHNSW